LTPRVFRVDHGRWGWWVIADGRGVMSSVVGEPRSSLIGRWESIYGRPDGGYLDVQEAISSTQVGSALERLADYPLPPARPVAGGGA